MKKNSRRNSVGRSSIGWPAAEDVVGRRVEAQRADLDGLAGQMRRTATQHGSERGQPVPGEKGLVT